MTRILQNFEHEVTELYKAYRMANFSLHNMKTTYYHYREQNPEISSFAIKDLELGNELDFDENEVSKNNEDGTYQRVIAGNTIAMFYNIWEDKYRAEIANRVSKEKNDIKSDFFQELSYIRHSITHNSFRPTSKLDELNKLSFIGNSTILRLSRFEVEKIKDYLLTEIETLKKMYCS